MNTLTSTYKQQWTITGLLCIAVSVFTLILAATHNPAAWVGLKWFFPCLALGAGFTVLVNRAVHRADAQMAEYWRRLEIANVGDEKTCRRIEKEVRIR
jgi:predicted amidohydrolase